MKISKTERILVIGCCGAGKSTFSKELEKIINLPVIHLDKYYHKPNWEEPAKEEWNKTLYRLVNKKRWIMDGNYSDSFDIRIPRAATIIYLDYSSLRCFIRVIKRIIKDYGKKRNDMAEGCKENLDVSFLKFVLTFNYKNRSKIYKRLEKVKNTKKVIVLKNDRQTSSFLCQLRANNIP